MTYRYITIIGPTQLEVIEDITLDEHVVLEALLLSNPNPEKQMFATIRKMVSQAKVDNKNVWIFWSDIAEHKIEKYFTNKELISFIKEQGMRIY